MLSVRISQADCLDRSERRALKADNQVLTAFRRKKIDLLAAYFYTLRLSIWIDTALA